jgi:phosphoserine phosphatase
VTSMAAAYPRIVFLDMEGTLLRKEYRLDDGTVAPSAWTVLAEALGPECLAAENATKARWVAKAYSGYLEWMRDTIRIHKQFGLTERIFREVIESVPFMRNVEIALGRIHAAGAVTCIVTGGFKALADRVQRRLRIHHAFAACDYFFDPDTGLIDHFNLLPADEAGKVDFMNLTCREYGVDPDECAFVGDGMNDVHLARAVGFSVAFNGQPDLVAASTTSIKQGSGAEDFLVVADVLDEAMRKRETGI